MPPHAVPVCDVIIKGVDVVADLLDGGVDGTYKVAGCHDTRPKYMRDSPGTGAIATDRVHANRTAAHPTCCCPPNL